MLVVVVVNTTAQSPVSKVGLPLIVARDCLAGRWAMSEGGGEVMMTSITVGLHGRTVSRPRLHGGA